MSVFPFYVSPETGVSWDMDGDKTRISRLCIKEEKNKGVLYDTLGSSAHIKWKV